MVQPQFAKRVCRPRDHLAAAGALYPDAWRSVDEFRADRGKGGLPDWPDWCFLPLAAAYAIVSADAQAQKLSLKLAGDVGRLGALAAWRVTQGIYRFDPAVYDAVRDTPLGRDLPCDVLYHLPEWCVYVETPGLSWAGLPLHGVFAHLEWDANTGRAELRLLLDGEGALQPLPLHLGAWPLAEALERMRLEADRVLVASGDLAGTAMADSLAPALPTIEPIVSLLLFLCSQASEIGTDQHRPGNPQPKRVRGLWRLFPADRVSTWEVGVRLGEALRRAYQAEETGGLEGTHARPKPHIRRAHWHGFWAGPAAGPRQFSLRWLPPIAVNVEDVDALPATVRPVR